MKVKTGIKAPAVPGYYQPGPGGSFTVGYDAGVPGSSRAAAVVVERRPDGNVLVWDVWVEGDDRPPPELGKNGKPVIDVVAGGFRWG